MVTEKESRGRDHGAFLRIDTAVFLEVELGSVYFIHQDTGGMRCKLGNQNTKELVQPYR